MIPCNWPNTGCPTCDGLACLSGAQRDDVIAWAISDLWEATGRVYGTCPVSVLPCQETSVLCGWCGDSWRRCGCGSVPEIKLPGPVASVTEVVIDGVELDQADYRIDDYQWLVRLDGGRWPRGSALDPDAFRVDYMQGIEPPAGAGLVTGILVCERAKAVCGDKTCRLPQRVQQVARQGVTMIWSDQGAFGLPEVDEWVRNANHPLLAGAVHSPDLPTVRRITWPL